MKQGVSENVIGGQLGDSGSGVAENGEIAEVPFCLASDNVERGLSLEGVTTGSSVSLSLATCRGRLWCLPPPLRLPERFSSELVHIWNGEEQMNKF
uniref:Uncharacterized protein n=1 Tax=Ditylenchus dipsaci TaxID=166011 RepID=A0A915CR46_9BILA